MKWRIVESTRFRKDKKRYRNDLKRLRKLYDVLVCLENTGIAPSECTPHKLHGDYEGCLECHIENNFLLIWIDENTNTIKLLRLGTHHE